MTICKKTNMYRDIIIFGTGEAAKETIPMLEKENHILFLVDNNENKWETTLKGYVIKSPGELKKYNCGIVITSVKYGAEIAEQLLKMGIHEERIFCCRKYWTDSVCECDVYPFVPDSVKDTEFPLMHYDLYHSDESGTGYKKVLVACTFFSVYTKQLIENMSKRYKDIEFSLLTCAEESREKITSEQLKHIYCFRTMADLKSILKQLPVYDTVQLLWIENEWCYFHKLIRKKARRINLNVGGSDFYRAVESQKNYMKNMVACVDYITAETEGTIYDFEAYYGNVVKNPIGLLPFGIEVLDCIKRSEAASKIEIREKFRIPVDKIVITCGHNAGKAHQHIQIIDAINRLSESVRRQIVCVFPMTYPDGQDDYIKNIAAMLDAKGLEYVILTDFMDFQSMAEYAIISDIMIHVQTTDQLSSTMLEEMYAGSIVIAGSWLPYKSLHEMGIYFLDVEGISDITKTLENVVENIDKYKQRCMNNPDIVWNHSSWDVLAPKWHALWE